MQLFLERLLYFWAGITIIGLAVAALYWAIKIVIYIAFISFTSIRQKRCSAWPHPGALGSTPIGVIFRSCSYSACSLVLPLLFCYSACSAIEIFILRNSDSVCPERINQRIGSHRVCEFICYIKFSRNPICLYISSSLFWPDHAEIRHKIRFSHLVCCSNILDQVLAVVVYGNRGWLSQ